MDKFKKTSRRRLGIITSENRRYKSFRIIIPMRFVKRLGWKSGQIIQVKLSGNHVTLWSDVTEEYNPKRIRPIGGLGGQ